MDKERGVLETDQGEEWDGTMHVQLWEDANAIDGPSAPYMTKEMIGKAPPFYCHPPLFPQIKKWFIKLSEKSFFVH